MSQLPNSLIIALAVGVFTISPAAALQKFEQYRIMGSEIASVRLALQEVEDPETLILTLVGDSSPPAEIFVESDSGVGDCQMIVESAIGDKLSYIQLTLHMTADTMNGVVLTECARISIPSD